MIVKSGTRVGYTPDKGRGVFALRNFKAGEVIEVAPLIVCPDTDMSHAHMLGNYLEGFAYRFDDVHFAVAAGNCSFFNHSYRANAKWEFIEDESEESDKYAWYQRQWLKITAVKAIAKDSQIYINYNGDPNSKEPVAFRLSPEKG